MTRTVCTYLTTVTVKAQQHLLVQKSTMSVNSHDVIVFLFYFFFSPNWHYTDKSTDTALNTAKVSPSGRCVEGLRGGGGGYIRNTPKRVFCMGALSAALRLRPRTMRVSAGSMIPSSHSLRRGRQHSQSHVRAHSCCCSSRYEPTFNSLAVHP